MSRFDVLPPFQDLGEITATAMLIEMPELGSIDNKRAGSLAGLTAMPATADSIAPSARSVPACCQSKVAWPASSKFLIAGPPRRKPDRSASRDEPDEFESTGSLAASAF